MYYYHGCQVTLQPLRLTGQDVFRERQCWRGESCLIRQTASELASILSPCWGLHHCISGRAHVSDKAEAAYRTDGPSRGFLATREMLARTYPPLA